MGVLSWRELPRSNKFRFFEPRDLTRQFVVTYDNNGPPEYVEIYNLLGIDVGAPHPEYPSNFCVEVDYEENYEGSQFHSLLRARYGLPSGGIASLTDPLSRPPIWTFTSQGAQVPALFYFDQPGNLSLKPLTNSAFDYFEGLTTDEAQVKVLIKQNLPNFPSGLAYLTNMVNSANWIGGDPHCWKIQGIGADLKYEEWDGVMNRYWEVSVEILFRQTGWALRLPDVGFNFIAGGQKRRGMVFDFQNSEWVASPGPIALDGFGNQTLAEPAILLRRVHREIDFNEFLGSPPA